ncbi:MAG: hypothetical protein AB2989_06760 [Candidatus Symbiodolus clandestinus]
MDEALIKYTLCTNPGTNKPEQLSEDRLQVLAAYWDKCHEAVPLMLEMPLGNLGNLYTLLKINSISQLAKFYVNETTRQKLNKLKGNGLLHSFSPYSKEIKDKIRVIEQEGRLYASITQPVLLLPQPGCSVKNRLSAYSITGEEVFNCPIIEKINSYLDASSRWNLVSAHFPSTKNRLESIPPTLGTLAVPS